MTKLLIKKMRRIGISDTVLQWFQSYLSDRTQQVKFDDHVSEKIEINHGVPQGTVLGPLLFIFYLNDLTWVVKNCTLKMFADDTLIYYASSNVNDINNMINEDLKNVNEWLCTNTMALNLEKTKFMLISNRTSDINCEIKLNNYIIETVSEFKYLGVVVDEHLTFQKHAIYLSGKINKKVGFLYRIGKYLSECTKLLIYKTIIAPHFNYCSTVIFMMNKTDLNDLQVAQNKALRCITRSDYYTKISHMLEVTSLLSVQQITILNTFVFIYKVNNNLLPKHLKNNLTLVSEVHNYGTRQQANFFIKRTNTTKGKNQIFIKGIKIYNEIPKEIKDSKNLIIFKKKCIDYVKQNWPV